LVKGKGKEWRREEGWRCGKEVDVDVDLDVDVDWIGWAEGMWGCDGLTKKEKKQRKSAKDHMTR